MAEDQQVIKYFMSLLDQIKLFHWASKSYAKHKALDELHSTLSDKIDTLIESYLGRVKAQPLRSFKVDISISSDIEKTEKFLEKERDEIVKLSARWKKYPELQNVLQEIANEINKTLYLCNLA